MRFSRRICCVESDEENTLLSILSSQWPITEVGLVCAITSAIHFPIVFLRDAATTLLEALFSDCDKEPPVLGALLCLDSNKWDLAGILIASAGIKIVLLVFTFGTKVPGGIFIPSLCTGALFGRALGIAMKELHHWAGDAFPFEECASVSVCIHPPIYAIVGGAAVLGGMTRMTVSLVVIMIEVTGGMAYVIPIMLGVIFAKIVGDAFSPNTIYLEAIRAQGYPLLDHNTKIVEDAAQEQTAADVLAHTNQGEITFAGAQQDAGGGGGGGHPLASRRSLRGAPHGGDCGVDRRLSALEPFPRIPGRVGAECSRGVHQEEHNGAGDEQPPPHTPKNKSLIPTYFI